MHDSIGIVNSLYMYIYTGEKAYHKSLHHSLFISSTFSLLFFLKIFSAEGTWWQYISGSGKIWKREDVEQKRVPKSSQNLEMMKMIHLVPMISLTAEITDRSFL